MQPSFRGIKNSDGDQLFLTVSHSYSLTIDPSCIVRVNVQPVPCSLYIRIIKFDKGQAGQGFVRYNECVCQFSILNSLLQRFQRYRAIDPKITCSGASQGREMRADAEPSTEIL